MYLCIWDSLYSSIQTFTIYFFSLKLGFFMPEGTESIILNEYDPPYKDGNSRFRTVQ